jgi:hypothetical protein
MDATQALAELTEISSQIRDVVLFDKDGTVVGTTLGDAERAAALAQRGVELLAAAEEAAPEGAEVSQVEAALLEASVFVLRHDDLRALALTGAEPTSGLVFYDLKSCLRAIVSPQPKPARRPRRKSGGKPDGAAA